MRGRAGYGLLIVFAVVMVGVLIAEGRPQARVVSPPSLAPVYRLFPTLDIPQRIIGMELSVPSEERLVAVVVEDDQETWRLRSDAATIVDADTASEARRWLGGMSSMRFIDVGDNPLDAFGFSPESQFVIRFQVEDLHVETVYIGDKTPFAEAYYVLIEPNGAIVHVVPAVWIDNFIALMLALEPVETETETTPTPDA